METVARPPKRVKSISSSALFHRLSTTMYLRYTNTQGNADDQFIMGIPTWFHAMWSPPDRSAR